MTMQQPVQTPTPTQQLPQWGDPGYIGPPRHRLSTKQWIIVGAAIAGLGLAVTVAGTDTDPAVPTPAAAITIPAPTSPAEPVYDTPTPADFDLALKIKTKDNFGSAGSVLTVEPDLTTLGTLNLDPAASWDITYEIRGGEDGPAVETLTLDADGRYQYNESVVDTTSTRVVPTARILSVEEAGGA